MSTTDQHGDYSHPILQLIIDLLEQYGPAELKGHYHQGDVLHVGSDEMPYVTLAIDSSNINSETNMTNKHQIPIVLELIYDQTNDLGTIDDSLQAGLTSLYKLLEGMELTSNGQYQLMTDTIAYVISKNDHPKDFVWLQVEDQPTNTIKYGMGVNRRGPGIYSVEATMSFTAYVEMAKPQYYITA